MKIKQEMVPINKDTGEYLQDTSPGDVNNLEESYLKLAMREVLDKFSSLPSKIQKDIIKDVRKNRGKDYKEISDRVKILVQKGDDLSKMTSEHSDRFYTPRKDIETLKLEEETDDLPNVDSLIEKLEEIIKKKDDEDDEEGDNHKSSPKEWIN